MRESAQRPCVDNFYMRTGNTQTWAPRIFPFSTCLFLRPLRLPARLALACLRFGTLARVSPASVKTTQATQSLGRPWVNHLFAASSSKRGDFIACQRCVIAVRRPFRRLVSASLVAACIHVRRRTGVTCLMSVGTRAFVVKSFWFSQWHKRSVTSL